MFLPLWLGFSLFVFVLSLHRLVPEAITGIRELRRRKKGEKLNLAVVRTVENAIQKSSAVFPALRSVPELIVVSRPLSSIEPKNWARSVQFALLYQAKMRLIRAVPPSDREMTLLLFVEAMDKHMTPTAGSFPESFWFEDFEGDLGDSIVACLSTNSHGATAPLTYALGEQVCAWSGLTTECESYSQFLAMLFTKVGEACVSASLTTGRPFSY